MSEPAVTDLRALSAERYKPRRSAVLRTRTWLHGPAVVAGVLLAHPTLASLEVGLPLVVLGLLVRTWALGHIRKDQALCTDGPYSMVRHPLYVGNLLVMAGLLVVAWNPIMAAVIVAVAAINYRAVIADEEKGLGERFGEEWTEYTACVPRLVPRLGRPTGSFSLGRALSNKAGLNWLAVGAVTTLLMLKPWMWGAVWPVGQ